MPTPDPRTDPIIDAYDRLVREAETPEHPVRALIVNYPGIEAPFSELCSVAESMGWQLGDENKGLLHDAFSAYRQRLQVELLEEKLRR